MEVAPINVASQDEIGQVARAFDQVHSEAVRLAGEQALLRSSFNAMFVNLSRRSQTLIERLARMIDNLEQNEDDPDRLGSLFSMDHLVTRMRRNSENLLLLAGHENPRKWSEPVPLADVARAATSEIEQYNRVTLNIPPGISVIGQAVSDVVHLLAELIENATIFSPKDTQVQVTHAGADAAAACSSRSVDKGIGVSEARLADMNWRLDNPPTIDVSVSRHMGLFAVARLAERHRVRVRLRPAPPQGLSALVWLPDRRHRADQHVRPGRRLAEPAGRRRVRVQPTRAVGRTGVRGHRRAGGVRPRQRERARRTATATQRQRRPRPSGNPALGRQRDGVGLVPRRPGRTRPAPARAQAGRGTTRASPADGDVWRAGPGRGAGAGRRDGAEPGRRRQRLLRPDGHRAAGPCSQGQPALRAAAEPHRARPGCRSGPDSARGGTGPASGPGRQSRCRSGHRTRSRSRLAGFQRGTRRAEEPGSGGQSPRAGEGSVR